MYQSSLPADWDWKEIAFSDVSGVMPGDGLYLVFQHDGGGDASGKLRYEDDFSSGLFRSEDDGASWIPRAPEGLFHYVYGTYSTPGPPQTATRYYVTDVGITLRAGDEPTSRVVTAVQTLNTPELLSGLWEAYFDSDPTLDHNGDGVDDWIIPSGEFDTGSLSGGVWHVDTALANNPISDFAGLTTINVRFRDTSADKAGAVFTINADWSGSSCVALKAEIVLETDATQTLSVSQTKADMSVARFIGVTGLSNDFVELRLLIDPDLDTVNVNVDGEDKGTFTYVRITPASESRLAMVYAAGGSAEFDYVTIRVSE
jgi:hypothetical protein